MSGESRDLPHAAGAFDLFLGGLPQQTVASVDHRETPQQFDKMATADLYRDLLMYKPSVPIRLRPEARNLDQPIIWITQTVATVLSSAKITTTEIMRACMKFQIIQFLL